MRFDNIEIGTSCYRTLIQFGEGNGIAVEPVKKYLDRLPDRKGWIKEPVAISKESGVVDLYYTDEAKIKKHYPKAAPHWVRGCNSIHDPHPTIQKNWPELIAKTTVKCLTPRQLCDKHDVSEVGFLKIDTEGHDCTIVNAWLDQECPVPEKLKFETNSLTDLEQWRHLVERLLRMGYTVKKEKTDTVCVLTPEK